MFLLLKKKENLIYFVRENGILTTILDGIMKQKERKEKIETDRKY